MIRMQRASILSILFMGLSLTAQITWAHTGTATQPIQNDHRSGPQPVAASLLNLPIQFEANHGQVDEQVKFLARGKGYNLFLTPTESVMVLTRRDASRVTGDTRSDPTDVLGHEPQAYKHSVVRMKLEGANPSPAIDGMEQLPGIVNYFIGNDPAKWRTKIPTYAKVHYKEAYPGIDLAYYGNQGKLEYDFIVAPGADPNQIKLAFEGASEITVATSGDLLLTTALGEVRVQKPIVYQLESDGHKTLVAGNYVASPKNLSHVQIHLAAYDREKPLVIDPVVDFLTYLGGKLGDANPRIAVDSLGNAYVAGMTGSLDFPTTSGVYDPSFNANSSCPSITVTNTTCLDATGVNVNFDYFVAKVNPSGSTLVYATYLGGTGNEFLVAPIAVDLTGNVYVGGQTRSADFPVTPGAFQTSAHHSPTCQPSSNCSADGFLTKLDPTGSTLGYSTYFGGNSGDGVTGITVDSNGFLYVTGDFASTDFPITPGAFSSSTVRGLLAKVNQTGTGLVWATRLGIPGSGFHEGRAIALDSAGNVILVGGVQGNVMPLVGAVQNTYGGNSDAFVWKFNPTGTTLLFSTFLGGTGVDWGYGVAVDPSDNIYLTGYTQSPNFPTTSNAYDQSHNGDSDIFVTKLSATGSPIVYSTFLGGSGNDENRADIVVDAAGQAYVAGSSLSPNFPLVNAFDSTSAVFEIVLAKLASDGSNLVYSSYLGGAFSEARPSIALGPEGSIYLAAIVNPTGLTTTSGVFQPNSNGGEEIFIAKITDKPLANAGPDQSVPMGTPVTLDGTGSSGGSLTYNWTRIAGPSVALSGASTAHPTFTAPNVPAAGATVTFQLIVCEGTSRNCSDPDTVNVHIMNVNRPPVAEAGLDQTVQEGSPVLLNGSASYDPDVESITYTWLQVFGPTVTLAYPNSATPNFTAPPVGASGGQVDFELIVTDARGSNHADYVSVFISNVNQPPVSNAGLDQTRNENTLVTLDGSNSTDPDLDTLHFTWNQTGGPTVTLTGANTPSPTFTSPNVGPGGALLTFQLVVTDGQVSSGTDTVQVVVQDVNDPPVCSLAQPSVAVLWPPNHTMVEVSILGVTDPNNSAVTISYPRVTQDEPINGLGDGDTGPDAFESGNNILLRAERAGSGNGRVYAVQFRATDPDGASCTGTVKVSVPKSIKDTAVDSGQTYNSFGP
ncbi:MAG: SBBP repeat-containing protein [Nitrospira sp.]|nr:SBBP repeat-containing protein [Nitrospira sp.]